MEGWIALDIDGTITRDKYTVPEPVVQYLRQKVADGWHLALATGRSKKFASFALEKFDFPYFFLPQNGSIVLQMPGDQVIEKNYIDSTDLILIDHAFEGISSDYIVYSGSEKGDTCSYRTGRFSPDDLKYMAAIQEREKETWQTVACFEEKTPVVKCFGPAPRVQLLEKRLSPYFQVSVIRDPFIPEIFVLLVTNRIVSKGLSLSRLFEKFGRGKRVIAAGDDANDASLFAIADFNIAMAHAPAALQEQADYIAPPTAEYPIIEALKYIL
jgi:HAD superfamily hydrolase (TIGR01484 family)